MMYDGTTPPPEVPRFTTMPWYSWRRGGAIVHHLIYHLILVIVVNLGTAGGGVGSSYII
jgi:hypothetical protein